ncbi:MAG: hypothetical protein J6K03_10035, partial [Oscillospiraceae bacterium]|nr:hypothetical protein [Oscillospiraceae bacterium]
LCPVSITTDFSLLGLFDTPAVENTQHTTAVEYIPYDVVHTPELEVQLPVPPIVNEAVNHALPQEHAALGADPLEGEFAIGSFIWLLGIGAMAVYSMFSYILLRRKLVGAVLLRDNIYLADGIDSPFVMGLFRPKIYLPSALSEQEQGYIILHEQHHIRRGDHLVKALAFIALCIHWFNPLVWVAFILSSKDMEMSCDEAVVKKLGEDIRADYSASLLSLATGRRIIAGTPLAFGEGDTKSRIKNMLSWKKPKVWLVAAATLAVVAVVVFCGTNADKRSTVEVRQTENSISVELTMYRPVRSFAIYEEVYQDGRLISGRPILLDGFSEDDWSRMPRKCELALYSTVGFDGAMTASCVMDDAEIVWDTELPGHAYTGIGSIVGAGNKEATLMEESHKISAGDSVILYSIVMSESPDGEVCVYHNGGSLAKANDTVVQYRLVTSTETAEAFEDMPLDLAQTLYDLRVETLNDPDDMGAQTALRILLDTMGASEFGDYELQYYDMSSKKRILTLKLAGEFWPGGSGQRPPYEKTGLCIWYSDVLGEKEASAFAEANKGVVELLLALVPDLDEVMIGYPIEGGSAGYIGASDKDASYVKDRLGYKDLEELGQSAAGIRTLMQFFDWPAASLGTGEALGGYGTVTDISYYLELAAGKDFREMDYDQIEEFRKEYRKQYEMLWEGYSIIARKATDGTVAYVVGSYNGDPKDSPLHGMYSVEVSLAGEEGTFQFLYREEASETVDAVLSANGKEFPPDTGYRIEDSRIYWSSDGSAFLIQPKENTLWLDVPWNRYLHTPNGREYITDAVSRGIDVCGRTDTFLYVYLISERFGEIAERIALTEAEAQAILAEERVKITDGFGFSASLHIDGQTTYYNEREGIPQTVLDLAVEKCDYRFGDPSYITDTIREAKLECDWLDTALYADEADLPRLREILKNAEHGYVGSCGYGAKLTLTFTGGEKLIVFKGCDGCDTIVFGSYGGYFLGERENIEFWKMFGLDPDTKTRIEANSVDAKDEVLRLFNEHPWRGATFFSRDLAPSNVVFGSPDTVTKIGRVFSSAQWEYVDAPASEPAWENLIEMYPFVFYDQNGLVRYGGPMKDSTPWDEPPMEEAVWYRAPGVFEAMEDATDTHFVENYDSPAEPTAPPADEVVLRALDDKHTEAMLQTYGAGNLAVADFVTCAFAHLAQEWENATTYTFYTDVFHAAYSFKDGKYDRVDEASVPTKLTFTFDGTWKLSELWTPGSTSSVGTVFPAEALEILARTGPEYYDPRTAECDDNAIRHYVEQTGAVPSKTFTPADVNFTAQALGVTQDEMTYEERLAWVQAEPVYGSLAKISLGQFAEGEGYLAYTGQWVGTPHMDQYALDIRFADGATASLPLPRNGYWGSALPDTMKFEGGKFVYEKAFPTEEVTNEGETLIHLKGTYHYEVDLVAKTVSLTVLQ